MQQWRLDELDELDERGVVAPRCGHTELPEWIEVGMCNACANEAVDRAQNRELDRERIQLETIGD